MTTLLKPQPATPEMRRLPATLSLTATAEFHLEAAAEGAQPAGLPRFRMVAYTGTPMRIAGWRYPVILDLAGLAIPSQARPIRFGHDPLSGVGHTDAIRIEQGQLVAAGLVSRDTAAAREVVVSSKNGFPWQASVGTSVEEFEFVKESQKVIVNGREYSGPLNVVRKATLGEISFVDLGADGATSASVAASAASTSGESSMDEPSATEIAAPVASATAVDAMRAEAAAETERIAAVRRICAGRAPRLEAQAIREGWSEQRTELEVLRSTRPAAPAIHSVDNTVNANVLEAACMLTAGIANPEASFEPQTLDLATRGSSMPGARSVISPTR